MRKNTGNVKLLSIKKKTKYNNYNSDTLRATSYVAFCA